MADGEVATDGDGASRNVVGVGHRDGLHVREVGRVEDDQLVGGTKQRSSYRGAAGDDNTTRVLANRHGERLQVQLSLLRLTVKYS